MEDKKFKKFVVVYMINILIIALSVVILVISSNGIIPEFFQKIGLFLIISDCIVFSLYVKKYKQ